MMSFQSWSNGATRRRSSGRVQRATWRELGVYIPFIDGGNASLPTVGFFDVKGRAIVEGEGVRPDIEVEDDPSASLLGPNPQLDTAIEVLLKDLDRTTSHQITQRTP